MLRRLFVFGMVCLLSGGLAGCGSRLTEVKGHVTYQGQPLADATVVFLPTQGQLATGVTDASGQFTLKTGARPGAEVGTYKVSVCKYSRQIQASEAKPEAIKKLKMYQGGKVPTLPKSDIPEKYGKPNQSGLQAAVTSNPAQNTFEFRLTD